MMVYPKVFHFRRIAPNNGTLFIKILVKLFRFPKNGTSLLWPSKRSCKKLYKLHNRKKETYSLSAGSDYLFFILLEITIGQICPITTLFIIMNFYKNIALLKIFVSETIFIYLWNLLAYEFLPSLLNRTWFYAQRTKITYNNF